MALAGPKKPPAASTRHAASGDGSKGSSIAGMPAQPTFSRMGGLVVLSRKRLGPDRQKFQRAYGSEQARAVDATSRTAPNGRSRANALSSPPPMPRRLNLPAALWAGASRAVCRRFPRFYRLSMSGKRDYWEKLRHRGAEAIQLPTRRLF